jgi:hypothetical protein
MSEDFRGGKRRRMGQKAIVIMLLSLSFSILGLTIFLDEHFYQTGPRQPEPQLGRVYPQWLHGTLVYLTRVEKLPFDYSWYAVLLLVTTAYMLNQRWRCFGPFTK